MGIWTGNMSDEWFRQQEINRRVDLEWMDHCKAVPIYDDNPMLFGMKAQFNAASRKRIDEEEVDIMVRAALED